MSVYDRIMVTLENTPFDSAILAHIAPLARLCGASLVLIHVADGWAARHHDQLSLRESEEMRKDREYLETTAARLAAEGFEVEAVLAGGDPAEEILSAAARENCDLIAMSTHGHGFLKDLVLGSVASAVRHRAEIPVLMIRARP